MPHDSRVPEAKAVIARYYEQHGGMPSVAVFAEEMGYSSTSSAHFLLNKLTEAGFLKRDERGGRLLPGPMFRRLPSDQDPWLAGIPQPVLDALPKGVELRALRVEGGFETDDAIWSGDLLLLAPASRTDLSDLLVLRRGSTRRVSNDPRAGWVVEGVVVGQYRAYGAHRAADSPSQ